MVHANNPHTQERMKQENCHKYVASLSYQSVPDQLG